MQFKDIIGHESVKEALRRSVREGRVSHARLFMGPAGVGKLQLAIAYAQYLACEHRTAEDSCGQCPSCLQFRRLEHPDLHFVFPIVKGDAGDTCDAFVGRFRQLILDKGYFDLDDWYAALGVDTKQGMIYEKESGEILRKLALKSFSDGYKVMIIWQADKMNATCANKLLKILEEPADKTVFILITEHPEWLLQTILSRVQQPRIGRLEESELAVRFRPDIVRIAGGSYLQAKRLEEGSEQQQKYFEDFVRLMRDAYTIGQIHDAVKKYESLARLKQWSLDIADAKVGRERQKAFLQYIQNQLRENYIYNLHQPALNYQTDEEAKFSSRFAPYIHEGNVEAIMAELDKAEQQISQNGNAKMIFFDLCLQMIMLVKKS